MEYARNYLKSAFYGDRNNCIVDGYITHKEILDEPVFEVIYKDKKLIVDTCNCKAFDNYNDLFEEIIIKNDDFVFDVVKQWYEEFDKGYVEQEKFKQRELNELIKNNYEEFTKFLKECYC